MRDFIKEYCGDDVKLFEEPSFETAFIGITDAGKAVYDYDLMIEYLVIEDDIDIQEATDIIDQTILNYKDIEEPIILKKMNTKYGF